MPQGSVSSAEDTALMRWENHRRILSSHMLSTSLWLLCGGQAVGNLRSTQRQSLEKLISF